MSFWGGTLLTLARLDPSSRLHALRQGLEHPADRGEMTAWIIGLAAACGLVALGLHLLNQRQNGQRSGEQVDYLARGATQAGLSARELDDLRLITTRARLAHPTTVLLSPENLEQAVRAATEKQADPSLERRMNRLSQKLFNVELRLD